MAAPTCMMDPNVHRAKNWLTRVRMEVGRRSREGQEQENNDGRHVGLDKKPSLMEVSRGFCRGIHQAPQTSGLGRRGAMPNRRSGCCSRETSKLAATLAGLA